MPTPIIRMESSGIEINGNRFTTEFPLNKLSEALGSELQLISSESQHFAKHYIWKRTLVAAVWPDTGNVYCIECQMTDWNNEFFGQLSSFAGELWINGQRYESGASMSKIAGSQGDVSFRWSGEWGQWTSHDEAARSRKPYISLVPNRRDSGDERLRSVWYALPSVKNAASLEQEQTNHKADIFSPTAGGSPSGDRSSRIFTDRSAGSVIREHTWRLFTEWIWRSGWRLLLLIVIGLIIWAFLSH